jgi:hypothetical protein
MYEKMGKASLGTYIHVFWDVILCCWTSTVFTRVQGEGFPLNLELKYARLS